MSQRFTLSVQECVTTENYMSFSIKLGKKINNRLYPVNYIFNVQCWICRVFSLFALFISRRGVVFGLFSTPDVADHFDWRLHGQTSGFVAGRVVRLGAYPGRVLGVLRLGLLFGRHLGGIYTTTIFASRLGLHQVLDGRQQGVLFGQRSQHGPFHFHANQRCVHRTGRHVLAFDEQHRVRYGGFVVGVRILGAVRPAVQRVLHQTVDLFQQRFRFVDGTIGRLVVRQLRRRHRPAATGRLSAVVVGRLGVGVARPMVQHPFVQGFQGDRLAVSYVRALGDRARAAVVGRHIISSQVYFG